MSRKDDDVKRMVEEQLFRDNRINASRIHVDLTDGRVGLRGEVLSHTSRQAAEEVARSVPGVRSVENRISVRYTEPVPGDTEIERAVVQMYRSMTDLANADIRVSVNVGEVLLDGTVDSYWKKQKAEEIARSATGVYQVKNRIAVVPLQSAQDELIAQDIARTLDRNPMVDVDSLRIDVENGVVTLSGTAPSYIVRSAAYEAARYIAGVTDVIDQIDIDTRF